jgi:hypothetical protein
MGWYPKAPRRKMLEYLNGFVIPASLKETLEEALIVERPTRRSARVQDFKKGITKKPAPKPEKAPRKVLCTRVPTPRDMRLTQKAYALMMWMATHPYPFQRVSPSKRNDGIYEIFKANGIPWPCTEFYASMEEAVNDGECPRASFEEILKFQRTIVLPKKMKERIESYKTMRQHLMEIREKLDLLQSNPRQAIEAEEKKFVDLTNNQEKKEIFASWILHPENVGVGWLHE